VLLNASAHDRAVGSQGVDCCLFVFAHEATVAFDIGTEDRGEFAFHCDQKKISESVVITAVVMTG
jgi:hypothetical protein